MKPNNLLPVTAIIVAGGAGSRLGASVPKAFVLLNGKPLFLYAVSVFDRHPAVTHIVLVVPVSAIEEADASIQIENCSTPITVVAGGTQRWQSVRNGIAAVGSDCDWVMVHDAARPFVTKTVIDDVLDKRSLYPCVITATPVEDTIRRFSSDHCEKTIDRSKLLRVGTPQLFLKRILYDAFTRAESLATPPTDEAMLMQELGFPVGFVWGDPGNFKITTPHDLSVAEALLTLKHVSGS
jgi:2-C-methyl-D-erythritol 4-phosphate cytidylyltransferase